MKRMDSSPVADVSPAIARPWWRHPACALVLASLVVAVVVAVRWRMREFPLERDEGEYAYMGRLILRGGAPYGEAANMKWPGTWLAYAAIMAVFGETTAGIHTGLLVVNLASCALLFVLGRRVCGTVGGAMAAAVHSVLAIGTPVMGLAAHATHFVVVCALGGFVVLTGAKRPDVGRLFAAGLLFGAAGLMKQAGAVFGLLAFGCLLWREVADARQSRDWRGGVLRLFALGTGGLAPLAGAALWIWWAGTWTNFWWWAVVYAKEYATLVTPAQGMPQLRTILWSLVQAAPVLWGAAALAVIVMFLRAELRGWRWRLLGFVLLSFAAVCPGWFFRPHYFLLLLPAVALLVGVATGSASEWLARVWPRSPVCLLPVLLVVGGAAQALWLDREMLFELTPAQACRTVYGINPFPESMEIARFLREHTAPDAKVAVLGSEPQIYFYADRRSPTPFLYVYPLVEPQPYAAGMQREFAQRIEAADPDYVVMVRIDTSWLPWPGSDGWIFQWLAEYQHGFQLAGLVEIQPDGPAEFRWFDRPVPVTPKSKWWVAILRNNRLAPE